MQWMKWTMMAALGCLPVLASADEPAKKPDKPSALPKIGLSIAIQGEDGKPHILVLGDAGDDTKNPAEQGKLTKEMTKRLAALVGAQHKGEPREIQVYTATTEHVLPVKQHHHFAAGYLGVSADPVPLLLAKHLGLHEGFGLVIDQVMPQSPAAKAGLQKFDVLQKIDDQLVINFEQLAVLVRSHKAGDEVKLSIIHEGKPAVVTAKLIVHDQQALGEHPEFQEVEIALRKMLPNTPTVLWEKAEVRPNPANVRPGAPIQQDLILQSTRVDGHRLPVSKTLVDNDNTYTLIISPDGHKTFVVTKNGEVVSQGPVNNKEQREKVPADKLEALKKLEKEVESLNQKYPGASAPQTHAPQNKSNPEKK